MKWVKMGTEVTEAGRTTTYWAEDAPYTIESRKRHIPHANGNPGTWDYTSYFVLFKGHELAEKHSLRDAKEYAEQLKGEDGCRK